MDTVHDTKSLLAGVARVDITGTADEQLDDPLYSRIEAATAARGEDPNGYRAEFVQLARIARELQPTAEETPESP